MLVIRPLELTDIPQVVNVHIEAFPDSFLTFLGKDILIMIYKEIARNGSAYVSIENGEVAGFVGGIFTPAKKFYQNIAKKNLLRLPLSIAGSILRKPTLLTPILARARGLLRKDQSQRIENLSSPYATLINSGLTVFYVLTVAVSPRYQRKGIASKIWMQLLKDIPSQNVDVIVVTVLTDNEPSNNLYTKMNFKVIERVPRPDGNDEFKWLSYQRGQSSLSDDGSVIWADHSQDADTLPRRNT